MKYSHPSVEHWNTTWDGVRVDWEVGVQADQGIFVHRRISTPRTQAIAQRIGELIRSGAEKADELRQLMRGPEEDFPAIQTFEGLTRKEAIELISEHEDPAIAGNIVSLFDE